MRYTKNLHLAKPSPDDFYDIAEFGNNMDILDEFYGTTFQESNRNLLDNAWFTLNSRGQNSYGNNTNSEMSVDRWRCDTFVKASYSNGKWTIRNDDSTNVRGFSQITVLDLLGKTVTYSVLVDGKITSVTFEVPMTKPTEYTALANKSITGYDCYLVCWHYPNGQLVFHINLNPGASIIPEAVKLELGEVSTLDKDNPPDDRLEYIKCITSKADPNDAYANKLINFASNRNLLDNWYFADPINQRGQTEYTDIGYTIDMWFLNSSNKTTTIKLTEEGIILENIDGKYKEYPQKIPYKQLAGKTVTISLLTGDVLETTTMTIPQEEPTEWTLIGNAMEHVRLIYYNSFLYFAITSWKIESVLLKAAKLELGTQQTLAHIENGKWVLNDPPPNYAEELLKCQRYLRPIWDRFRITRYDANYVYAYIKPSVEMRKMPTLIITDSTKTNTWYGCYVCNGRDLQDGFSFVLGNAVYCDDGKGLEIAGVKTSHGLTDGFISICGDENGVPAAFLSSEL